MVLHLLAEAIHMLGHGGGSLPPLTARPHGGEQLVTRAGATRVVDEVGEQLELLRREGDQFAVDPDLACPDVDLHADTLGHEPIGRTAAILTASPEDRSCASGEFSR